MNEVDQVEETTGEPDGVLKKKPSGAQRRKDERARTLHKGVWCLPRADQVKVQRGRLR